MMITCQQHKHFLRYYRTIGVVSNSNTITTTSLVRNGRLPLIASHPHRFFSSSTTKDQQQEQQQQQQHESTPSPLLSLDREQSENILNKVLERLRSSGEVKSQMSEIAKLDIQQETLLKWASMVQLLQQEYAKQLPDHVLKSCSQEFGTSNAEKYAVGLFKNNVGKLVHQMSFSTVGDTNTNTNTNTNTTTTSTSTTSTTTFAKTNNNNNNDHLSLLVNEINALSAENCFEGIVVNKIPRLTGVDDNIQYYSDEELRERYIQVLQLLETMEFEDQITQVSKMKRKEENADIMKAIRPVIFKAQLQVLESHNQFSDMKQLIQEWINFRCALDEWVARVCNNDPQLDKMTHENHTRIVGLLSKQAQGRVQRNRKIVIALSIVMAFMTGGLIVGYLVSKKKLTPKADSDANNNNNNSDQSLGGEENE